MTSGPSVAKMIDAARPRLQIAIDVLPLDDAVALATAIEGSGAIVEAGTPFIKRDGMTAIRALRAAAPGSLLLADMKTMDAGALEAGMAFDAGADIVTVLGCASDATISAMVDVARHRGGRVVADLIGVVDKPGRAEELAMLGVDLIGIHTGTDDQTSGADPLADLAAVRARTSVALTVAGGVTFDRLPALLAYQPAVVIVGSAITAAVDRVAVARSFLVALAEASER